VAIIHRLRERAQRWAERVERHLVARYKTAFRLTVTGDAGLTEVLKDARAHGAHRILAVGDEEFIRWSAQAMVGSLMPLAPALLPRSRGLFGHRPLSSTGWQNQVEHLLLGRFQKVDMAMGNVRPFLHQLLAGFPAPNGSGGWHPMAALFGNERLELAIEIDRAHLEGEFWCLVIANADFATGRVRWLPGSSCTDQCLDLLAVRPRPFVQRVKFLRAMRQGRHGGLPGVVRFRGQRITVHALRPWHYAADGGPRLGAANPLVLEARPQQLRLVVPERS
jgi:hypothetical protein